MSFKALVTRYKISTIIILIILGLSLIAGSITAGILLTRQSTPPADAATFTDANGIEYSTSGTEATVTGYSGSSTTVVIPNTVSDGTTTYTVTTIAGGSSSTGAFANNTTITSLTIGENITTIQNYAFYDCTALTEINFNAIAMNDLSSDNYVFYSREDEKFVILNVGENVTRIPARLFYPFWAGYRLEVSEINFIGESKCEVIGAYAFYYSSITNLKIPKSVTTIEASAFTGCSEIASIEVDNENTSYCTVDGILYNMEKTDLILCPKKIQGDVAIPDTISTIPASTFAGCVNLTSVVLPNGLTAISRNLFSGCINLVTVNIPAGVTSIGNDAFSGCTSLNNVTLPEGLETIGEEAFYGCSSFTTITIPESVTTIGNDAFTSCRNVSTINYNAINLSDFDASSASPFDYAGYDIEKLTVNIGENVTIIPAFIFYSERFNIFVNQDGLKNLKELNFLGDKCTKIREWAFGYTGLLSVTIPASVTSIEDSAFYVCKNLSTVYFENNLTDGTRIGDFAFRNNSDSATYYFTRYNTYNLALNNTDKFTTENFVFLGEAYTITVNATTGGTATGGGTYDTVDPITLTATANTGYRFVNWTDSSGTILSTSSTYNHTVTKDETITANFKANTYTVRYNSNRPSNASHNVSGTMSSTSHTYGIVQVELIIYTQYGKQTPIRLH